MPQITIDQLREELKNLLDNGLTNAEIANRLNEKYEAEDSNRLVATDIPFYKKKVGLKGARAKKRKLFELVDSESVDAEEPQSAGSVTLEVNSDTAVTEGLADFEAREQMPEDEEF